MNNKSIVSVFINVLCWFFFVVMTVLTMRFSFAFSPYTPPVWYSIVIQLGLIVLPLLALVTAFFVRYPWLKYLFILGNAAAVYLFTIPYAFAWIGYFQTS